MTIQLSLLPAGFGFVTHRWVFIPNDTTRPGRGGQWFNVDVGPLMVWTDDNIDTIIASASAYYFTLSYYADMSEATMKSIAATKLESAGSAVSATHVRERQLPRDQRWGFYNAQTKWLKNAVKILGEAVIPLLQTLSANRRPKQGFYVTGESR
jgi:hypothetical protein